MRRSKKLKFENFGADQKSAATMADEFAKACRSGLPIDHLLPTVDPKWFKLLFAPYGLTIFQATTEGSTTNAIKLLRNFDYKTLVPAPECEPRIDNVSALILHLLAPHLGTAAFQRNNYWSLFTICRSCQLSIVLPYLDQSTLSAKLPDGMTLLNSVIKINDEISIDLLLKKLTDEQVEQVDNDGCSALHYATNLQIPLLKRLIDRFKRMPKHDRLSKGPLIHFYVHNCDEAIRCLLPRYSYEEVVAMFRTKQPKARLPAIQIMAEHFTQNCGVSLQQFYRDSPDCWRQNADVCLHFHTVLGMPFWSDEGKPIIFDIAEKTGEDFDKIMPHLTDDELHRTWDQKSLISIALQTVGCRDGLYRLLDIARRDELPILTWKFHTESKFYSKATTDQLMMCYHRDSLGNVKELLTRRRNFYRAIINIVRSCDLQDLTVEFLENKPAMKQHPLKMLLAAMTVRDGLAWLDRNMLPETMPEYRGDPAAVRQRYRRRYAIHNAPPAQLFAMMVLVSDGLMTPTDRRPETARFFKIAEALPMDLQQLLALRTFDHGESTIGSHDFELGLRAVLRQPYPVDV